MPHPWLTTFALDHERLGPSAAFSHSALGQQAIAVVLSLEGVTALVGAIDAAPTRPPLPALDRYILSAIGPAALSDDVKILCGRVVRQVVEHLGGQHVRKGVSVTVASSFANGSIYALPSTRPGKFGPAQRRAWAEQQVAASAFPVGRDLSAGYAAMAADEEREIGASIWSEALQMDVADEPRRDS